MLLVVVACPHCRRVQVVEARVATPRCRGCGKGYELATRRTYYQGEDAEAARRAASTASLQVGGAGIEAYAESVAAVEAERQASFDDVVRALSAHDEFSVAEVDAEVLRLRVRTTGARVVEALRRENRVYEPRPGRFRWIVPGGA